MTILFFDFFFKKKVCVAASGGKDSTVLAHVMTRLNAQVLSLLLALLVQKYNY
jgi:tRNA(Ile)-lysidine synthase TilS/MesJ